MARESLTIEAPWAGDEQLGLVVARFCSEASEASFAALDAAVSLASDLSFPKNMLMGVFLGMYNEDCVDEAAFVPWRTAEAGMVSPEAKSAAVTDLAQWYDWLAEQDEDDEEEDDEE